MATKQNPGANDCYEKAEMDEPLFTLLARDKLAPGCVRLWAALRAHDTNRARDIFTNLVVTSSKIPYSPGKDPGHVIEARECANAMDLWHTERSPRPKDVRAARDDLDAPIPAEVLAIRTPVAKVVEEVRVGDRPVDKHGRPLESPNEAFLYKGFGEMVPLADPWPKVRLEDRTGPHGEAIDRWAVIVEIDAHKPKVVTIFEDMGAEARARDAYRSALIVHGAQPAT